MHDFKSSERLLLNLMCIEIYFTRLNIKSVHVINTIDAVLHYKRSSHDPEPLCVRVSSLPSPMNTHTTQRRVAAAVLEASKHTESERAT